MAQRMERFILANLVDLAERELQYSSALRQSVAVFQDKKTWVELLAVHDKLAGRIEGLKKIIDEKKQAGTKTLMEREELQLLIAKYQKIANGYGEITAWEAKLSNKIGFAVGNRDLFLAMFDVEAKLREAEQALAERNRIFAQARAKYGNLEQAKNLHALKEVLMANKAYEKACIGIMAAADDDTMAQYKLLRERLDRIESHYGDMVAWEERIGVRHETSDGRINSTCREAFLIGMARDPLERLMLDAEIFLTRKNLRTATQDMVLLVEQEKKSQATLRNVMFAISERIEQMVAAGTLRHGQLSPETRSVMADIRRTDFYKKDYALVHRDPAIWDSLWAQKGVEDFNKAVEFVFPVTHAAATGLAENAEKDRMEKTYLRLLGTVGGSLIDAAALVLLGGAVQEAKLAIGTAIKLGLRQAAKQAAKKGFARFATKTVAAKTAARTAVKLTLLALPYYHSFKGMMAVLDDETNTTADRALAIAKFAKDVIVFERLFKKGPGAIADAVGRTMANLKKTTEYAGLFKKRPLLEKVLAHGMTIAISIIIVTESKTEKTAIERKALADEYAKLGLNKGQQRLLPQDEYRMLKHPGTEKEQENDFNPVNIRRLLDKYPEYAGFCQNNDEGFRQPLRPLDYLYMLVYHADQGMKGALEYTEGYNKTLREAKVGMSFPEFASMIELADKMRRGMLAGNKSLEEGK